MQQRPRVRPLFFRSRGRARELWPVLLGMAVGAKQNAFHHFPANLSLTAIRKRADVERKRLRPGLEVVPHQGRKIAPITAARAALAAFFQQCQLSFQAPGLLRAVALVALIGVEILASARAKSPLPTGQPRIANDAALSGLHQHIIGRKMPLSGTGRRLLPWRRGPIAQWLEQGTHRKVPPRGNAWTGSG